MVGTFAEIDLNTIIKPKITKIIKRIHPKFIDFKNIPSLDFTTGLIVRKGNPQLGQAAA